MVNKKMSHYTNVSYDTELKNSNLKGDYWQ